MNDLLTKDPIDAVITWVDGTAPHHRAMRERYMAEQDGELNENASNPHRWESSDEIYYCLQSIHNHAPWVRYIWIVVERDGPDLSRLPPEVQAKVRLATHAEIFDGYADALPTFNSLAIESVMWRIEGLSERFLYFNDDVFLTAPLEQEDMFDAGRPVLRGSWRDYTLLARDEGAQSNPAMFNHVMQINAAELCGFPPQQVFAAAHVVHPLRRNVMAYMFTLQRAAFEENIACRFRDLRQFLPQGLHNHACIAARDSILSETVEHLHIKSGQGTGRPPEVTRALLLPAQMAQIKFLCVNDLPQLEALVPDARALIARAIGGVAS